MDPWRHIEELAQPTVPPGPSEILDDALIGRVRGVEGLVALRRWAEAEGGLPMRESLDLNEPTWWSLPGLIFSALEVAARRRDLEAIGYLTRRLQAEGEQLVDAMLGIGIAARVQERARELVLGFWERALGDAELDEPYDTTVARLYEAAETDSDRRLRSMIKSMAIGLDRTYR